MACKNPPYLIASHYTLAGCPIRTPSQRSLTQRLSAAEQAGYSGIGINQFDIAQVLAHRSLQNRLHTAISAGRAGVVELEMLWSWFDLTTNKKQLIEELDAFRRFNSLFGNVRINIGPPQMRITPTLGEELRSRLEYLDQIASQDGFRLGFEFQHGSSVQTLAEVEDLFRGTRLDSTGLVIDAWHFFRGRNLMNSLDQVTNIPIYAMQLCDGAANTPLLTPFEDTTNNRLVPGDGEFPLRTFIGKILEYSPTVEVTVEIINPLINVVQIDTFAEYCFVRTSRVIEESIREDVGSASVHNLSRAGI